MKNRGIYYSVVILVTVVFLSGCGIFSLHPLYKNSDLRVKNELIGSWMSSDEDELTVIIDTVGNSKYEFILIDGEDTVAFEMGLMKLKNQYFIDLYPLEDCGFPAGGNCDMVELLVRNYIPIHTFMKLDYTNGDLILTEFDNERLIDLFANNRIRLPHEMINEDEYVVITASTDDLQKFISRYANDLEAFNDPEKYHRL
jgi:hypothetical protein